MVQENIDIVVRVQENLKKLQNGIRKSSESVKGLSKNLKQTTMLIS